MGPAKGLGRLLAIVLAGLLLNAAASAAPATLSGEVTYLEKIELPGNASLTVKLLDLTAAEPGLLVSASAPIASRGQVPLQFTLNFEDARLRRDHRYALIAEITASGGVWFRNATPFAVDPRTPPQPLTLIVNFVGQIVERSELAGPTVQGSLKVSSDFTDTIWVADRIGARPIASPVGMTLSVAADRRAGGASTCNNYFAEASFEGRKLRFGAIVATRRLCAARVMDEERAFFAALSAVRGYRLAAQQLELLDARGSRLLRLQRAN